MAAVMDCTRLLIAPAIFAVESAWAAAACISNALIFSRTLPSFTAFCNVECTRSAAQPELRVVGLDEETNAEIGSARASKAQWKFYLPQSCWFNAGQWFVDAQEITFATVQDFGQRVAHGFTGEQG